MTGVPDALRAWWSRVDPAQLDNVSASTGRIEVLQRVAKMLSPGDRVLDLGCGPGLLAREAKRPDILGVDMSPAMVAAASQWMDTAVAENILEYWPTESPHVVVLCNVLESYSLEVRRMLYSHVREFLAPGGRIIVVVAAGKTGLGSASESVLDLVFPTAAPVQADSIEEELALAGFDVALPELLRPKPAKQAEAVPGEATKTERRSYAVLVGKRPAV